MVFTRYTLIAAVAALAGVANADLTILAPGGPNLWWVADSTNTLLWTCQDSSYQNFTVLIANSNPTVLEAPAAIIAVENNYDCSKTITDSQSNLPPSTGYVVQLANPLNDTDVYAQSQEFEIKSAGSAYPASSATPTSTATATSGASGSASGSGSTASPTSSSAAGIGKGASVVLGGLAVLAASFGLM
ncbi:hypothetical protein NEOLEDRAFT_1140131 [Neolentinus lepideus HHB14362 ss-1]|uniref:Yeast cell wall synthesis Kre9/Knh1-like N-terminal domain-containing protein n=1 Tax=Neolentinus lepideus HHB14362 ss-1 TaxID=1314782 RepID=A0A165PF46_9AGAM|nr:hypothetical protein NEOLEDRAFT_1140131 [Neolentinus lepideus HHB14362 ss-1]